MKLFSYKTEADVKELILKASTLVETIESLDNLILRNNLLVGEIISNSKSEITPPRPSLTPGETPGEADLQSDGHMRRTESPLCSDRW